MSAVFQENFMHILIRQIHYRYIVVRSLGMSLSPFSLRLNYFSASTSALKKAGAGLRLLLSSGFDRGPYGM